MTPPAVGRDGFVRTWFQFPNGERRDAWYRFHVADFDHGMKRIPTICLVPTDTPYFTYGWLPRSMIFGQDMVLPEPGNPIMDIPETDYDLLFLAAFQRSFTAPSPPGTSW